MRELTYIGCGCILRFDDQTNVPPIFRLGMLKRELPTGVFGIVS